MKNTIRTTLGLALALSLCMLTAVSAEPTTRPLDFSTQMTPSFPMTDYAGVYLGTLHLNLAPDNTVSGWYRSQDAGPVQAVVGGRDGESIWFDIGSQAFLPGQDFLPGHDRIVRSSGPLQVVGTLKNGRIEGSAQNGFSRLVFIAQEQSSAEHLQ